MNEAFSERTSYSFATEKGASQNEWNLCRLREDIQSLPNGVLPKDVFSRTSCRRVKHQREFHTMAPLLLDYLRILQKRIIFTFQNCQ